MVGHSDSTKKGEDCPVSPMFAFSSNLLPRLFKHVYCSWLRVFVCVIGLVIQPHASLMYLNEPEVKIGKFELFTYKTPRTSDSIFYWPAFHNSNDMIYSVFHICSVSDSEAHRNHWLTQR